MKYAIALLSMLLVVACIPQPESITTTTQAKAFASDLFEFECEPPNIFFSTITEEEVQDENGYYGMKILGQVEQATEGGSILYQLWIDPNNQYIYKQQCDPSIVTDCPMSYENPLNENPNYLAYISLPTALPEGDMRVIKGYMEIIECDSTE